MNTFLLSLGAVGWLAWLHRTVATRRQVLIPVQLPRRPSLRRAS